MQNPKRASYCSAIRSEMVFRHSYPAYNPSSFLGKSKKKPQVDVEELKFNRFSNNSNTSLSSHDSGVGFSKADYEIQRAIRAQRVQRPHIIVLHKGKPINSLNNHEECEANIVVAAATASKRNRREISVMQKRQTLVSIGNNTVQDFSRIKNHSAPNLHQTTYSTQKTVQEEQKENKDQPSKKPSSLKHKLSLRSVSLSIKKFMGMNKEKKRRSQLIQQIREQPKLF